METHIGVSEKRNLDGIFLVAAVVVILAAIAFGWRNYAVAAPVPPWRSVVAEARLAREAQDPRPFEIVLVGANWSGTDTIDGVERSSVATMDDAPQGRLVGDPKVFVLVRKATWEADRERPWLWGPGQPLQRGGGKWLFVHPPPGVE